ncbi:PREDICTED: vascular cell adhesion protein 1 [Nanorana parkeri]|uniref:vascular cell adhesion protein 1 n=1 Tax=Nanorana parkeri TaxID=125878 RepID=UPI00085427DA|nr:PREDICTED: vascular cell adhesion protein 1 [Nanorana parkeri]
MSGGLGTPTVTIVIGYIIYLQVIFTHGYAKNITLISTQSIITSQIGEELRITCLGTKCQNPDFIWAALSDNPLRGTINNNGQISVLTMKISSENLDSYDSYRCTVSCDNPPAEKGFKIIVYSFPEPILTISSLMAGEQSHIACTIPDAYPFYMFNARILVGEKIVAEYKVPETDDFHVVKNISLSHDLMLTDEYEAKEVKCEADLQFQEEEDKEIAPINRNTTVYLSLLYPPGKPVITVYPDTNVFAAENISLSCTYESRSPANVKWVKLDKEKELVMSHDQGILAIPHAEQEDSGVYICRVQNNVGTTSSEVQITVQVPPENTFLTITPSLVTRGESVHIRCTSEAFPAPRLVLKKQTKTGLMELEAEDGQYSITHMTEDQAGTYICEASNVVGLQDAEATVTVQVPPKNTHITITPPAGVREGDFIDIRCSSEASPAPRLVLKVKTEHGVRELVSEGGQSQIEHAAITHSGTYICESTNVAGQQIVETTLTIQVPPKKTVLTISPSPLLKEGESGYVRCTSEAFPAPRLVLKKKTEAGLIELEMENGEYSITQVGVQHAGTYLCESTNEAGQQTAETTLIVQAPPKNTLISITPSSVVKEGEDVQIQCLSEAYPSPKLVLLLKTKHGLISQLESDDGLYNITNAGEKNMGTYICESTNVIGQQTAEATLTVQIPPRKTTIVTPSQNITAGVTVTITYDTHIIPPPERQQSSRFDYVPPAIIGSVVLLTAGFIGTIAYHLKQAKVQGSYSLVKALRSKV